MRVFAYGTILSPHPSLLPAHAHPLSNVFDSFPRCLALVLDDLASLHARVHSIYKVWRERILVGVFVLWALSMWWYDLHSLYWTYLDPMAVSVRLTTQSPN